MTKFAVKAPGQDWRIAEKVKASEYGLSRGLVAINPDRDVWSEVRTTAFIDYVGSGETVIKLPDEE